MGKINPDGRTDGGQELMGLSEDGADVETAAFRGPDPGLGLACGTWSQGRMLLLVVATCRGPGKPSERPWAEQVGQALPESVTSAALTASHGDFCCRGRGGRGRPSFPDNTVTCAAGAGGQGQAELSGHHPSPSCPADAEPLCGCDHGQF